ncbi:MAG: winged helix-turn-helix transcriptional regulator [Candidatus Altiarchaeota archaeon]|nr:winged helix-turn-helix transcriptional regulator [Candidatus Altiarchaeota archaeon]
MRFRDVFGVLRNQLFVALFLFLLFSFLGGIFSGHLALNSINFRDIAIHIPLFSFDYVITGDYGFWIGVLATSATLAAFLSTYLGKRLLISYKYVNYPEDHLKTLRSVKGKPKTAGELALEFDVPLSVTQRVLDDLEKEGLVNKMGDGKHTVYYFPFEKRLAEDKRGVPLK